ncbi:TPA: hypothetical protein ACH3X1_000708 [Trebouxia sp. C0004]
MQQHRRSSPSRSTDDGLKNSIVRLKNCTEAGLERGRKTKAAPLGNNTDSAESQAAPFKQPAAKRRNQTSHTAAAEAGR